MIEVRQVEQIHGEGPGYEARAWGVTLQVPDWCPGCTDPEATAWGLVLQDDRPGLSAWYARNRYDHTWRSAYGPAGPMLERASEALEEILETLYQEMNRPQFGGLED